MLGRWWYKQEGMGRSRLLRKWIVYIGRCVSTSQLDEEITWISKGEEHTGDRK
jgi:hypothetical protein